MSQWLVLSLRLMLWSWYTSIGACDGCGACLQPPAFISNFITIRAQSASVSTLTIDHGLREVPIRVEVQVRPSPGRPDTEYVFPGLGSTQADDDLSRTYGGVVYKYNAQSVVLAVPKQANNYANGTTIYTGDNIWIGPKPQNEVKAEVRVKVWTNCTFPTPTFESSWILMKSGNGSSMRRPTANHWGGVLYGVNETHVRIWVPHTNNGLDVYLDVTKIYMADVVDEAEAFSFATHGKIFSVADGWGIEEQWSVGLVKVRVWETFGGRLVYHSATAVNSGLNAAGHEMSMPYSNIESGMIDVKIKTNSGDNTGFHFPASGAVQNAQPNESYGGVVYSYSENGVRFWHPHLSTVGSIQQNYLVYIDSNWGGGINPQASTSGDLIISFWNASVDCSASTTTMSTTAAATTATTKKPYTTIAFARNRSDGGVSKLAVGLIITACLITAGGCGIATYFGARKMKNSKKNNRIDTES